MLDSGRQEFISRSLLAVSGDLWNKTAAGSGRGG
jgi:hypothetical protein